MANSIGCNVGCPNCGEILEFELTGEAELAKTPETLTVRYFPIVIQHVCKDEVNATKV